MLYPIWDNRYYYFPLYGLWLYLEPTTYEYPLEQLHVAMSLFEVWCGSKSEEQ
jgi:hypothetical protein